MGLHFGRGGAIKPFVYWDGCEDQTPVQQQVYGQETQEAISKLVVEDSKLLKDLGDLLIITRPALTNNRDASASERVISVETKQRIDELLVVSEVLTVAFEGH